MNHYNYNWDPRINISRNMDPRTEIVPRNMSPRTEIVTKEQTSSQQSNGKYFKYVCNSLFTANVKLFEYNFLKLKSSEIILLEISLDSFELNHIYKRYQTYKNMIEKASKKRLEVSSQRNQHLTREHQIILKLILDYLKYPINPLHLERLKDYSLENERNRNFLDVIRV